MIVRVLGKTNAPPRPCNARLASWTIGTDASPPTADATT
jgi:hypothetical protein